MSGPGAVGAAPDLAPPWRRCDVPNPTACSVAGCDRPYCGRGLCRMHLKRLRRNGTTELVPRPVLPCSVEGCDRRAEARGMCKMHRRRVLRHGDPSIDNRATGRKPCSEPGCERVASAKGLCAMHRRRVKRLDPAYRAHERQRDARPHDPSRRLRTYGLTEQDYRRILDKQGGVCGICRQPERRTDRKGAPHALSIDHCHLTGEVRGLLCKDCNAAIGMLGDTLERVEAAVAYLRRANH